ncbi:M48 family metallopeptidase [Spongiivirga sp. MCCC 1A20706]|uniref:M48 family metallopeptidase n=1 Tax=Spongiivirga sp. MCCC 1A20706 TaxID=3160963 RepID=UPI00397771B5
MKRVVTLAVVFFIASACKTNPFTGKQYVSLYGNNQLFPMAFQQYDQFLNENKVVTGTEDSEMIKRVGQRMAVAAERWLNALGQQGYLTDYRWEYNLVNSDQLNAWCMPGGKIVFYTGILPVTQTETGVAVVMGHEIAHALANHGAQRMTAGTGQQLLGVAGNVAFAKNEKNRQLFNQIYGVGSQVGFMLPFSRSHESEADAIGLTLMAIAGYNPDEGAELWRRMKAKSGGQAPPEILSTHPSSDTRIANLTALAPKAKEEAKKFGITKFRSN